MAKEDDTIRFKGVRLPANVMLPDGTSGFALGNNVKSGFGVEGIVKEIRMIGPNALLILEDGNKLVLFSSGMLGECV